MQKTYCDKCSREIEYTHEVHTLSVTHPSRTEPLFEKDRAKVFSVRSMELCPWCRVSLEKWINEKAEHKDAELIDRIVRDYGSSAADSKPATD